GGVDVALAGAQLRDQVGANRIVQNRRMLIEGRLDRSDRCEWLETRLDQLEGILGLVAAGGDDDGDRLADVACPLPGQWELEREAETGHRGEAHRDLAERRGQVVSRDSGHDARRVTRR